MSTSECRTEKSKTSVHTSGCQCLHGWLLSGTQSSESADNMHPLLIPAGILLFTSLVRQPGIASPLARKPAGPRPTPPPGASVAVKKAAVKAVVRKAIARKVKERAAKAEARVRSHKPIRTNPVQIEHPDVLPASKAPEQAAVDAVMTQVIRENHPMPPPAAPTAPVVPGGRTPKDAAKALQKFLLKTGRFGTLKDRPQEVILAQRDLGVAPDGIVGKRTRAAAAKQGVALPPVN